LKTKQRFLSPFRSPLAAFFLLQLVGCGPGNAKEINDQQSLQAVLKHDIRASVHLSGTDEHVVKGETKQAESYLDKAWSEVQIAEKQLQTTSTKSSWGETRSKELSSLIEHRKRAIGNYREALKSNDKERWIKAMEEQRGVEKEALQTSRELTKVPAPSGGCLAN
jgi:hypothetical protein